MTAPRDTAAGGVFEGIIRPVLQLNGYTCLHQQNTGRSPGGMHSGSLPEYAMRCDDVHIRIPNGRL